MGSLKLSIDKRECTCADLSEDNDDDSAACMPAPAGAAMDDAAAIRCVRERNGDNDPLATRGPASRGVHVDPFVEGPAIKHVGAAR